MPIKQFEDENLSHYSYAVLEGDEVALVDPSRNPQPYYDFARENNARIKAVIETHPHADFISSHLEIHRTTGAWIYSSLLLGAKYPQQPFDEGQTFLLGGNIKFTAWNTPGHSPDSITVILTNEKGRDMAAFTGDTLFIGDCGRPDLREHAGDIHQQRKDLARQMFYSLKKFHSLDHSVVIYPAHGAGSLCGRNLSKDSYSTVGKEASYNWCLQPMEEEEFVRALLEGQPFIPKYFVYDVEVNIEGAPSYEESISRIPLGDALQNKRNESCTDSEILRVDSREPSEFHASHADRSINIPDGLQFETWLGTMVEPGIPFYLIAENMVILKQLIARAAKIGYEAFIKGAYVYDGGSNTDSLPDIRDFSQRPDNYTILDVRAESEASSGTFHNALHIPLDTLSDRIGEIPLDKPVIVHCASGYRSAIASSLLNYSLKNSRVKIYDLGEAIKSFDLSA